MSKVGLVMLSAFVVAIFTLCLIIGVLLRQSTSPGPQCCSAVECAKEHHHQ